MEGTFISYLRVSTAKQGVNGLGIDAQRTAITDYLNGGKWELLREFVEVESGKRTDNRPVLQQALEACRNTGATLLIAKLDRLSRNMAFIANLMESKTTFVAVDDPTTNNLTLHIRAAIAQHEREMISKRTKEALKAAKERGTKLGNPLGLSAEAVAAGIKARQLKADEYAMRMYSIIKGYQGEGMSLNAISRKLTEDRELTSSGKGHKWTATAVKNVLLRLKEEQKP